MGLTPLRWTNAFVAFTCLACSYRDEAQQVATDNSGLMTMKDSFFNIIVPQYFPVLTKHGHPGKVMHASLRMGYESQFCLTL
jgi:hypothetical protein